MARQPSRSSGPSDLIEEASTERAIANALVTISQPDDNLDGGVIALLSRAELDVQITTARSYPRQIHPLMNAIYELATLDTPTATSCFYSVPRDGKAIIGPSVRLAELVAQCWGNCRAQAQVTTIDRKEGFIEAEGTFHDLQSNYAVKERVRRSIKTRNGIMSADMINVTGNAARSIAFRNAVFKAIPRGIYQKAFDACLAAARGDLATLGARRVSMLTMFRDLGVEPSVVYQLIGVKGENDVGLDEMVVLAGFYSSLKNGEATVAQLMGRREPGTAPNLGGAFTGTATKPTVEQVDQDTGEVTDDKPAPTVDQTRVDMVRDNVAKAATDPHALGRKTATSGGVAGGATTATGDGVAGGATTSTTGAAANGGATAPDTKSTTGDDGFIDDAGAGDDAGDDAGEPEVETETEREPEPPAPAFDVEAFADFQTSLKADTSWLTIKAKMIAFRKTDAFKTADAAARPRVTSMVLAAWRRVSEAGDPAVPSADPTLFSLWVTEAPIDDIRPMHQGLIRSKAYTALTDEQKDMIGDAVAKRLSPDNG